MSFAAGSHRDFGPGIFASRRESWQDSRQDPGEILAAGIFASRQESWRDSKNDPGEILAAGNFTSPAGMKNPGGQNLAGIPAKIGVIPPRYRPFFYKG